MVAFYIFVAGIAGSAQIIGAIVTVNDGAASGSRLLAHIRYIAIACVAVGTALLIADLKTPRRFYNMLRIFRATSPMSFGSYVFTGFGAFCAALAGLQLLADLELGWAAPYGLMLLQGVFAIWLWGGVVLVGLAVPLALAALTLVVGGHLVLAVAIACAELTGSLLWRYALLAAGNESALRPGDYFTLASRRAA